MIIAWDNWSRKVSQDNLPLVAFTCNINVVFVGGGWDQGCPCNRRNREDANRRGETPNPTPGPEPVMTLSRLYPQSWASSHAVTATHSMSAVSQCFCDTLISWCQRSWYLSTSMCVEVLTYINIVTTSWHLSGWCHCVSISIIMSIWRGFGDCNLVSVLLSSLFRQCHCCMVTRWQLHSLFDGRPWCQWSWHVDPGAKTIKKNTN